MKELMEYRVKMLERLDEAVKEFCAACESFNDPFTKADGDWTVHQIAAHARDVDQFVYGMRIRRTMSEENPLFQNFDGNAWMAEHYRSDEPLAKILKELSASIQDLHLALTAMPVEGWSRESSHESMGGGMTLQVWVERSLAHIEEHLQTLKKSGNP